MRKRKQFPIGKADLEPGERRLIEVDGKTIGLFNIDGEYFAMHNRCPHMAGPLCEGPVTGTAEFTDNFEFNYVQAGELVRCGWHGWEFEIKSGQCLIDQKMRARTYSVVVDGDSLVLQI